MCSCPPPGESSSSSIGSDDVPEELEVAAKDEAVSSAASSSSGPCAMRYGRSRRTAAAPVRPAPSPAGVVEVEGARGEAGVLLVEWRVSCAPRTSCSMRSSIASLESAPCRATCASVPLGRNGALGIVGMGKSSHAHGTAG